MAQPRSIRLLLASVALLILLRPTTPTLAATPHTLRAGAASANITPAIGTLINGGSAPAVSTHVHDELHARALVLDDGQTRMAIVTVDSCLIDRPVFDEAKDLIQRRLGIRPDHVLISCTHTHSGGSVTGVHLTDADPAYRRWLPGRILDSVIRASNLLAPARAGWGSGSLPQHVFCRRLLLRPGNTYTNQIGEVSPKAKMNWDSPHPDETGPAGPTDPEVFVLSLQHTNGQPLALLANYSLHYVGGVPGGHISADYFGAFANRIGELLQPSRQDPPFVAFLSNGTSGDINNVNPAAPRVPQAPYAQIHRVAEDLAQEVLQVVRRIQHRADLKLSATLSDLPIRVRKPSPQDLERARQLLQGRTSSQLRTWPEIVARDQLLLAEYPDDVLLPIQILRIGQLNIAGWPGEIFASSGLELKRKSAPKPLFNISLANGWFGYIPPPEQHALGAYETWRMRTSPLEVQATVKIIDEFLRLLTPPTPQSP